MLPDILKALLLISIALTGYWITLWIHDHA